jgi:hypothetical protein
MPIFVNGSPRPVGMYPPPIHYCVCDCVFHCVIF